MGEPAIILAVALAAVSPPAEAVAADPPERAREWTITWENDFLHFSAENHDRYYTNGFRVEWIDPARARDGNFLFGITHDDWCRLLCGSGATGANVEAGWAMGHAMYTPSDLSVAAPQPNDWPWAGMLYGSRIARVRYETGLLERQDQFEATLGIVGPAAVAEPLQRAVHFIIRDKRPLAGWHNQLKSEPVVQLRYDAALRWPKRAEHLDITPRLRATLGNARIAVETDATFRVGANLPRFGIAPRGSGRACFGLLPSCHMFLRAGLAAAARDIFLDGNTFASNDIRIDRKPLVTEYAVGAEVDFVYFRFGYQWVHRSSEFRSWDGRDAPGHRYAAVTVRVTQRR